ncbi:MAG: acyltransferase family protein [Actinomycetia bacterium]|nr:acyltransferase family protein [Actinomycetes bacterium]
MTNRSRDVERTGLAAGAGARRNDIQWLRALAVLSVVTFHAGLTQIAPGGFVGVDVFFVISGYLILRGIGLELDQEQHFDAVQFLSRRVMRILPMLLLVILVTAAASWFILNPIDAWTALRGLQAGALHYANIFLAGEPSGYFAADQVSPAVHLWSISVEEQFYFAVVILGVLLASRTSKPWVAVIAGVTAVSFVLSVADSSGEAYYWPWTRAWELGIGALLGLLSRGRRRPYHPGVRIAGRVIGIGMIVAAIVTYDSTTSFPTYKALLPVLGAAIAIWAGAGTDAVARHGRSGSFAPGNLLGDISYSLYLWHWPILVLSAAYLGRDRIGGVSALVAVAVAIVLSVVSYHAIERPLMTSPVRKSQPRMVILYGVAAFLIVAAVIALAVSRVQTSGSGASPSPTEPTPTAATQGTDGPDEFPVVTVPSDAVPSGLTPGLTEAGTAPVHDANCLGVWTLQEHQACWFGDTSSERDVVVFGDSHAAHLIPALDEIGKDRGLRIMPFVINACPSLEIAVDRLPEGPANPYCLEWREAQQPAIAALDPELIILSNQVELYTPLTAQGEGADAEQLLEDGLSGVLDLLPADVPVVIVSDSLTWPQTPVNCLADSLDSATDCRLPRDHVGLYSADRYEDLVAGRDNVRVLDILDLTCADDCYAIQDNLLIYQDTDHFSQAFMRWLTPAIDAGLFEE